MEMGKQRGVQRVAEASKEEGHNQPAAWSIRLPEEKSAWLTQLHPFYGIENSSTKWCRATTWTEI